MSNGTGLDVKTYGESSKTCACFLATKTDGILRKLLQNINDHENFLESKAFYTLRAKMFCVQFGKRERLRGETPKSARFGKSLSPDVQVGAIGATLKALRFKRSLRRDVATRVAARSVWTRLSTTKGTVKLR